MTILGGVLAARNQIESPALPLTSATLVDWLAGPRAASGVAVSEKSVLGLPAVWRAVSLIAGVSASLPIHAYRRGDETRLPLREGYAATLAADPHPDMTRFEFWETVYAHRALWGNAYIQKLRNPLGQVVELWPIHPSRVRVGRESDAGRKVYEVDGDEPYSDDQIMHVPGFGYDGVCGVSVVRAARQGLGLSLAAEEFGARLFANGTLASGILQTEQRLKEEEADALKARWKAKKAGLQNAHDVVILDRGAKFQPLTIPPDDAQFLESRQFQITEVARLFGVPPFLMYQTEKSTSWGTGLEQQALGWVRYDLRRWTTPVEERLSKEIGPSTTYFRYDYEGLLRGDSQARATFYKSMWDLGVYSTNEIRELEELAPVDGGDARYRPLNMGRLGEFDDAQEATANA